MTMRPSENEAAGSTGHQDHIMREALFYEKAEGGIAICALCPRRCAIPPGATGTCLARRNLGGTLYSLNYSKISSLSLDPIEKKPLYRFHPGSWILSAGSFGCNFMCPFCQNHSISRSIPQTYDMPPESLVERALLARADGNIGIAYTYNEPIIWYEYVKETAALGAAAGLRNVLVTNGCIEHAPLDALLPYIDAMNVDLKGDDEFYSELCKGWRAPVIRTIEASHAAGCHVEATMLLVSGRNDNRAAVEGAALSIAAISEEIPLHLSRFFPRYKMAGARPTDPAFVFEAAVLARRHLKYVYPGNV